MQFLCTFDIKIIDFLSMRLCTLDIKHDFIVYAGFMHLRYQKRCFFEYVQVLCTLDVKSKSFNFLTVYECLMRFWVLCAFDINIIDFFFSVCIW